ncbi:MAG: sulfite exporter TauE/SafE family protein [Betaproteobacteria bacterium]|jgi:hypothetical protein|nr:sulfite exporter TauE/SafE family protein [Betaproteobacteria bacterium]
MQDPIVAASFVALAFLLAGMVKGVVGMGLPTIAIGILGVVMAPVEAAALLVVPSLVTNIWQLVAGPSLVALFRRFATLMIGVCVGTAFGIGFLTGGATALASAALGTVLALYGALGLISARVRVRTQSETWLSPIIGVLTGILTGATGVFAIPAVPYFSALGLEKEELVQMLGILFTVCTAALAIGLIAHGRFPSSVATGSLFALIPTLGGMLLGQKVRNRLEPQAFRRWFYAALVLLGSYMVARALIKLHA